MGLGLLILVLQRCCVGYIVFYSFKALKQPRTSRRIPSANGTGTVQTRKASQEAAWAKAGGGALTAGQKARRTRIRDMVRCWFIYVSYRALEGWASSFAWAVPFYDEIHLLWLLFLLFSGSQGPEMLFRRLVKPLVAPYERLLDSVLGGVHDVLQIIGYLVTLPLESFRKWKHRRAMIDDARARATARDLAPPTRLPRAPSRMAPAQPDDIFAPHRRTARARIPVSLEPARSTADMLSLAAPSPASLPGGLFPPTPEPASSVLRRPAPVVLGAGADEYRKELKKLSRPAEPAIAATPPTAELETEAVDLATTVPLPRPDPDSTIVVHDVTMSEVLSPVSEVGPEEEEQEGGVGPQRSSKGSRSARKSAVASPKRTPRRRATMSKPKRDEEREEAEEEDDMILPPSLTVPPTTAKKRRKLAASRSLLHMDLDSDSSLPPAFDDPDPHPPVPSTARRRPRPSSPTFSTDPSMSFSQAFADLSYRPSSNAAVQLDQDFFSPTKVAPPRGKRKLHDPDEPLPTPLSSEGGESRDDPREMTLGSLRSLGSEWDLKKSSSNVVGAKALKVNGAGMKKSVSTAKVGAGKPRSSVSTKAKIAKPTAGPSSTTAAGKRKVPSATTTMDELDLTKLISPRVYGEDITLLTNTDLSASTSTDSSIGIGRPSTIDGARRLGSRSGSVANGLANASVGGTIRRQRTPSGPTTGVAVRKAGRAPLTDQGGAVPRSVSTRTVGGVKSATRRPSTSTAK